MERSSSSSEMNGGSSFPSSSVSSSTCVPNTASEYGVVTSRTKTAIPAMALTPTPSELSLASNNCPNCKLLNRYLRVSREWNNFFRLKLDQKDTLLHIAADYKRQKQRSLQLQMSLDQQTRECSEMREQLTNLLLEIQPLRERLQLAEQRVEEELKRREKAESEECNLRFLLEQQNHKLEDLGNRVLPSVSEKKLNVLQTKVKKMKMEEIRMLRTEWELREATSLARGREVLALKKAYWGLSLALKYGRCLKQVWVPPKEEWGKLQRIMKQILENLNRQYSSYCSKVPFHHPMEEWINDFPDQDREESDACGIESGAKQLEKLIQDDNEEKISEGEMEEDEMMKRKQVEKIKTKLEERENQEDYMGQHSISRFKKDSSLVDKHEPENNFSSSRGEGEVTAVSIFDSSIENIDCNTLSSLNNNVEEPAPHLLNTEIRKEIQQPILSTSIKKIQQPIRSSAIRKTQDLMILSPIKTPIKSTAIKKTQESVKSLSLLDTSIEDSDSDVLFPTQNSTKNTGTQKKVQEPMKLPIRDAQESVKLASLLDTSLEDSDSDVLSRPRDSAEGTASLTGIRKKMQEQLESSFIRKTQQLTKITSILDTSMEDSDSDLPSFQNSAEVAAPCKENTQIQKKMQHTVKSPKRKTQEPVISASLMDTSMDSDNDLLPSLKNGVKETISHTVGAGIRKKAQALRKSLSIMDTNSEDSDEEPSLKPQTSTSGHSVDVDLKGTEELPSLTTTMNTNMEKAHNDSHAGRSEETSLVTSYHLDEELRSILEKMRPLEKLEDMDTSLSEGTSSLPETDLPVPDMKQDFLGSLSDSEEEEKDGEKGMLEQNGDDGDNAGLCLVPRILTTQISEEFAVAESHKGNSLLEDLDISTDTIDQEREDEKEERCNQTQVLLPHFQSSQSFSFDMEECNSLPAPPALASVSGEISKEQHTHCQSQLPQLVDEDGNSMCSHQGGVPKQNKALLKEMRHLFGAVDDTTIISGRETKNSDHQSVGMAGENNVLSMSERAIHTELCQEDQASPNIKITENKLIEAAVNDARITAIQKENNKGKEQRFTEIEEENNGATLEGSTTEGIEKITIRSDEDETTTVKEKTEDIGRMLTEREEQTTETCETRGKEVMGGFTETAEENREEDRTTVEKERTTPSEQERTIGKETNISEDEKETNIFVNDMRNTKVEKCQEERIRGDTGSDTEIKNKRTLETKQERTTRAEDERNDKNGKNRATEQEEEKIKEAERERTIETVEQICAGVTEKSSSAIELEKVAEASDETKESDTEGTIGFEDVITTEIKEIGTTVSDEEQTTGEEEKKTPKSKRRNPPHRPRRSLRILDKLEKENSQEEEEEEEQREKEKGNTDEEMERGPWTRRLRRQKGNGHCLNGDLQKENEQKSRQYNQRQQKSKTEESHLVGGKRSRGKVEEMLETQHSRGRILDDKQKRQKEKEKESEQEEETIIKDQGKKRKQKEGRMNQEMEEKRRKQEKKTSQEKDEKEEIEQEVEEKKLMPERNRRKPEIEIRNEEEEYQEKQGGVENKEEKLKEKNGEQRGKIIKPEKEGIGRKKKKEQEERVQEKDETLRKEEEERKIKEEKERKVKEEEERKMKEEEERKRKEEERKIKEEERKMKEEEERKRKEEERMVKEEEERKMKEEEERKIKEEERKRKEEERKAKEEEERKMKEKEERKRKEEESNMKEEERKIEEERERKMKEEEERRMKEEEERKRKEEERMVKEEGERKMKEEEERQRKEEERMVKEEEERKMKEEEERKRKEEERKMKEEEERKMKEEEERKRKDEERKVKEEEERKMKEEEERKRKEEERKMKEEEERKMKEEEERKRKEEERKMKEEEERKMKEEEERKRKEEERKMKEEEERKMKEEEERKMTEKEERKRKEEERKVKEEEERKMKEQEERKRKEEERKMKEEEERKMKEEEGRKMKEEEERKMKEEEERQRKEEERKIEEERERNMKEEEERKMKEEERKRKEEERKVKEEEERKIKEEEERKRKEEERMVKEEEERKIKKEEERKRKEEERKIKEERERKMKEEEERKMKEKKERRMREIEKRMVKGKGERKIMNLEEMNSKSQENKGKMYEQKRERQEQNKSCNNTEERQWESKSEQGKRKNRETEIKQQENQKRVSGVGLSDIKNSTSERESDIRASHSKDQEKIVFSWGPKRKQWRKYIKFHRMSRLTKVVPDPLGSLHHSVFSIECRVDQGSAQEQTNRSTNGWLVRDPPLETSQVQNNGARDSITKEVSTRTRKTVPREQNIKEKIRRQLWDEQTCRGRKTVARRNMRISKIRDSSSSSSSRNRDNCNSRNSSRNKDKNSSRNSSRNRDKSSSRNRDKSSRRSRDKSSSNSSRSRSRSRSNIRNRDKRYGSSSSRSSIRNRHRRYDSTSSSSRSRSNIRNRDKRYGSSSSRTSIRNRHRSYGSSSSSRSSIRNRDRSYGSCSSNSRSCSRNRRRSSSRISDRSNSSSSSRNRKRNNNSSNKNRDSSSSSKNKDRGKTSDNSSSRSSIRNKSRSNSRNSNRSRDRSSSISSSCARETVRTFPREVKSGDRAPQQTCGSTKSAKTGNVGTLAKSRISKADLFGTDSDSSGSSEEKGKEQVKKSRKGKEDKQQQQPPMSLRNKGKNFRSALLIVRKAGGKWKSVKQPQFRRSRRLSSSYSSLPACSEEKLTNQRRDHSSDPETDLTTSDSSVPHRRVSSKCQRMVIGSEDEDSQDDRIPDVHLRRQRKTRMDGQISDSNNDNHNSPAKQKRTSHLTPDPHNACRATQNKKQIAVDEELPEAHSKSTPSISSLALEGKASKTLIAQQRKYTPAAKEREHQGKSSDCRKLSSFSSKQQQKIKPLILKIHQTSASIPEVSTSLQSTKKREKSLDYIKQDQSRNPIKSEEDPMREKSMITSSPSKESKHTILLENPSHPFRKWKRNSSSWDPSSRQQKYHKVSDSCDMSDNLDETDRVDDNKDSLVVSQINSDTSLQSHDGDALMMSGDESETQVMSESHDPDIHDGLILPRSDSDSEDGMVIEENTNNSIGSSKDSVPQFSESIPETQVAATNRSQEGQVVRLSHLGPVALIDQPKFRKKPAPSPMPTTMRTSIPAGPEYIEKLFSSLNQKVERSLAGVTQNNHSTYPHGTNTSGAAGTASLNQPVRGIDYQGQFPVFLPNIYGTLQSAPAIEKPKPMSCTNPSHCTPHHSREAPHSALPSSSHAFSSTEQIQPNSTSNKSHPVGYKHTTAGTSQVAPLQPLPSHSQNLQYSDASPVLKCNLQQMPWLPEIRPEEVTSGQQQKTLAIEELEEALEEILATRLGSKWWVAGLQQLCASINTKILPYFLRLVLKCIMCADPQDPQTKPKSLPPKLYQLFQVVFVIEQRLTPHHPRSLHSALLRAIQAIVSKPDFKITPQTLASLTTWYIASTSIDGQAKKGQKWRRARTFLMDLLFHHPNTVHLALLTGATSSRGVFCRNIKNRVTSGLELVIVWLAHYGAWVGEPGVRSDLTKWLEQHCNMKKPPQNPAPLIKNLVTLLDPVKKRDLRWGAATSLVVLARWHSRAWARKHLLPPLLTAAGEISMAVSHQEKSCGADSKLIEDFSIKISHLFSNLSQALPCGPQEKDNDDIVEKLKDAVTLIFCSSHHTNDLQT